MAHRKIKIILKAGNLAKVGRKEEAARLLRDNQISSPDANAELTGLKLFDEAMALANAAEEAGLADIHDQAMNDLAGPSMDIRGRNGQSPAEENGLVLPTDPEQLDGSPQENGQEFQNPDGSTPVATPAAEPSPETVDPNAENGEGEPTDGIDKKKIAREALKKKIGEAKAGLTKFLKKLLTSPHFWIAFGIIAVGIGIYAWLMNQANSGVNGKTPLIATSPTTNRDSLQKLNLLTGDQDAQQQISQQTFKEAQKNLLALKEQTTVPATKTKIDEALAKIDLYLANNDTETGKSAIALIKEVLALIDNSIPKIQGRYPINPADITTFNSELHLGTPLRPEALSYDKGHGTYIYSGENKCDAVDVFTKPDVNVYPAITGEVMDVSDDGTGHKKVVIKNGDYQLLYANFDPTVAVGDKITDLQKPIGKTVKINDSYQLHIELTYCGVCLVTSPLDKLNKETKNQATWGEFLWAHIKDTLKLQ